MILKFVAIGLACFVLSAVFSTTATNVRSPLSVAKSGASNYRVQSQNAFVRSAMRPPALSPVSRRFPSLRQEVSLAPRAGDLSELTSAASAGKELVENAVKIAAPQASEISRNIPPLHDSQGSLPVQFFTSLADAASEAVSDPGATGAAAAEVAKQVGLFGKFVALIAGTIVFMSNGLQNAGVEQSVGLSIVLFTLFVKAVTFPLNEKQIKSSETMAIIQPKIKELQEKYKDDPNKSAQKLQEVYAENNVNPLAGLLPTFAQIPIFIALYRALQNLATEGMMNQPFLWLPNLEGPTFGPIGTNWLFGGFHDGVPQYGWHDTLAYLSLPAFLIVSQIVSQRLLVTKEQYDAQPQWTKFLPIIFGYFSLNVPSGLAIYWVANNLITTTGNLALKSKYRNDPEIVALRERISKVDAPVEKQMPYVKPKEFEPVEQQESSNESSVSSRGKGSPPKMKKQKKKKGKKNKKKVATTA